MITNNSHPKAGVGVRSKNPRIQQNENEISKKKRERDRAKRVQKPSSLITGIEEGEKNTHELDEKKGGGKCQETTSTF